jgi:SAM-dependent methyltransferase
MAVSSTFDRDYFAANYANYQRQNPPRKLAFYRRLIEPAATCDRPAKLLEIGCAFGGFLSSLDDRWRCWGLDVSDYAIEQARLAAPTATLAVASGARVPFAETFDCVAAFDVIEHIQDLEQVADGVFRHLRPGGYFVFVVPVYDGPTGPIIHALDRDPTHLHKRSRQFWIDWLTGRFELVDWHGVYRYLLPLGYYVHLPTRRFRRFTPAIAVVARRPLESSAT